VRLWTRAVLTAAALIALAPAAASADPALDPTAYDPDGDPGQLAQGPDGNVYVALTGNPQSKEFARINTDGSFTYVDTPVNGRSIVGLSAGPDAAGGPNDKLWLSYGTGVIKVNPATGAGVDFPIATLSDGQGITPDAAGNIWVVDAGDGLIKLAPNGVKIDDVPVTAGGRGAALGGDGRVWWADFAGGKVHATSTTAPYATQDVTVGGGPQQVAAGPGNQIGYGAPSDSLGRIASDGTASPTTATGTDSFDVTLGGDGAYWYAQSVPDKVARLTTDGQYTQPITLPAGAFPRYLAADASNNVWVQGALSKVIYKITGVEPPPQPQDTGNTGNTGDTGNTGNTGDTGNNPLQDTVAPVVTRTKLNLRTRRLTVNLSEPAALETVVQQKVKRGNKRVWKRVRGPLKKPGAAGANSIALGKKFKKGSYRALVTATDTAGNKTAKPLIVTFKVK